MKIYSIALLLSLVVSRDSYLRDTDNFEQILERDITNVLNNKNGYEDVYKSNKIDGKGEIDRKLFISKYKTLQRNYSNLKVKYEQLLSLYKAKGYISQESPNELGSTIDLSRLSKKQARKLFRLRKLALKHHRKLENCTVNHNYYVNDDSDSDDSRITSAAEQTANALGIHNSVDLLAAGAGIGTLAYGIKSKNKNYNAKKEMGLAMQKAYVLKEEIAKMLTKEIKNLKTLVESIETASRRVTSVNDNLCSSIDSRMMYLGGQGY